MMGGKRWTSSELDRVKKICDSGGYLSKNVHLFPGRTLYALEAFATRNGIETRKQKRWTKKEDEIVAFIWESERGIKDNMHLLPGRTYHATKERAGRLNLGHKTPAMLGTRSWVYRCITNELKKESPLSMNELAERIGTTSKSVQGIISLLRGKEFYVKEWKDTDANHKVMRFALGSKKDAVKPLPKPMKEAHRAYRLRQKIKAGIFNPFAVAAGFVDVPQSPKGRVYKQDMTIYSNDLEDAA